MRYSRAEQETALNYDVHNDVWYIYSTYPPHIRQLKERATITEEQKDEQGRTIFVMGTMNRNQVRLFMPRKD